MAPTPMAKPVVKGPGQDNTVRVEATNGESDVVVVTQSNADELIAAGPLLLEFYAPVRPARTCGCVRSAE